MDRVSVKVRRGRLEQRLGPALGSVKAAVVAVNEKYANKAAALTRQIVPKGDTADGHLAQTVRVGAGDRSDTSRAVTLGDAAHPYGAHLEFGHAAPDGSHVPGYPALTVSAATLRKAHRSAMGREVGKALKAALAQGRLTP